MGARRAAVAAAAFGLAALAGTALRRHTQRATLDDDGERGVFVERGPEEAPEVGHAARRRFSCQCERAGRASERGEEFEG